MDYVFGPKQKNSKVFELIAPLLTSAEQGENVCIIAYGASGSGKSHTMYRSTADCGIIPRSIEFLLKNGRSHVDLHCSIFEIYNETFIDLLRYTGEAVDKPVCLMMDQISNVKEVCIESITHFNEVLKEANDRRKIASTQRNHGSSRSHAIVRLRLSGTSNEKNFESTLMLLDLAGTENANDHLDEAGRDKRIAEMGKINKSVSRLRAVIEDLKKGETDTDFRSSKLTHLLKPCLTKNTNTLLITTISPEVKYLSASKESLGLAKSAIKIKIKNVKQN